MVAAMTELLTVLPPIAVAVAIVAAAAVAVHRLGFAKRDAGE
jgi:hypothetical protein